MYRYFAARNFRCFKELELRDLKRVNLITGVNNVGKTALLEAIFLHCGAYNPELTLRLNAFRGIEVVRVEVARWAEAPWDSLFYQLDTSKPIEIVGENTITKRRVLRLRTLQEPAEIEKLPAAVQYAIGYRRDAEARPAPPGFLETVKALELEYEEAVTKRTGKSYLFLLQGGIQIAPPVPSPPFPAFLQNALVRIPPSEDAERYSKLEVLGKQEVLVRVLRLIEPRLKRLAVVALGGNPMLYGDTGHGHMLPLPLMGGGMVRLTSLILHIANAPDGVVLVDEIENGIHHSVLPEIWRATGEVAREFRTQVFATTHSIECVAAAHKAFSELGDYDFGLYRLENVDGTVRAYGYDHDTLDAALEVGLEVR